MHGF